MKNRFDTNTGTVLARGTLYHLLTKVVYLCCGLVMHVFLGRYLGPRMYGIAGVVITFLFIVRSFGITGIYQTISKFVSANKDKSGAIKTVSLKVQAGFTLFLAAILYLLAEQLADFLNDPSLVLYLKLSALLVPIMAIYAAYHAFLNGMRWFGRQATVINIYAFTRMSVVVILVITGFKVYGVIGGYFFGALLATLAGYFFCRKINQGETFSAVKIIMFSIPVVIFFTCNNSLLHLDLLFVKAMTGSNELTGYYTSAATLSKTFYTLFSSFGITLLPSISESFEAKNIDLTERYIRQSTRYFFMLSIPAGFAVSFSASPLIEIIYSSGYSSAGDILGVLVWGHIFFTVFFLFSSVIIGIGKPYIALLFGSVLVPLDILLNLMLIPSYGTAGAAFATVITTASGVIAAGTYITLKFSSPIKLLSIVRIGAAGLIAGLTLLFKPDGFLLILYYIIPGTAYFILLVAFREFKKEDFKTLKDLLTKRKTINE